MTIEAANIIKASPDGSHLIASFDNPSGVNNINNQYLFDFNNAIGQLSNPIIINSTTTNGFFISSEFSHNSRYLYTVQWDSITPYPLSQSIVQYDLQAANINASANVISALTLYGSINGIQIGPDGRIYFVESYSDTLGNFGGRLGRINCPNTTAPVVELNVFQYANSVFSGLPNFPAWLFEGNSDTYVSLGPDTLSICEASGTIELNALNPGATYLWSTGATSQSINVTGPGTYSVTVNGPCGAGSDQIVIVPCNSCVTVNTSINASACESYSSPWGTIYNQTGIYKDTLITAVGCDSIIQLNLTITSLPTVTASSVAASCGLPNGTATATATGGSGNYSYSWNTTPVQTTATATNLAAGSYTATVTDATGCKVTQSAVVAPSVNTANINAGEDKSLLPGSSVPLEAKGGILFSWSPPDGLSCTDCSNPIASPKVTTTYVVQGENADGCKDADTVLVILMCGDVFVPNAFSPNGDGENDVLKVYGNCISELDFAIFDRWGEKVFSATQTTQTWDGTFKGQEINNAVVYYRLSARLTNGQTVEQKGNITLVK